MALNVTEKEDRTVSLTGEIKSDDEQIVVSLSATVSSVDYSSPNITTNIVNKNLFMKNVSKYQGEINEFTTQVYTKMTEILGGAE